MENIERSYRCRLHTGPLDKDCSGWLEKHTAAKRDLGVSFVCIGTESLWVDVMALSPLEARWILRLAFGTGFPAMEVKERMVAGD